MAAGARPLSRLRRQLPHRGSQVEVRGKSEEGRSNGLQAAAWRLPLQSGRFAASQLPRPLRESKK